MRAILAKLRAEWLWPFLLPVVWGILYWRTRHISNPAVMGDEEMYFINIGNFAKQRQLDTSQYGPLYVLCASLFYDTRDILRAYWNIRVMNVMAFGLAYIPLRLMAGYFFRSALSATLLAVGLVLMPWSTLITPIWAEPLFFMLGCWSVYMSLRAFRTGRTTDFALAGAAIGLTLLTKQGGGLGLACGYLGAQSLTLLWRKGREASARRLVAGVMPIIVAVLAYLLVTRYVSVGGVGYSGVVREIVSHPDLPLRPLFWRTVLHQLAYVVAGAYFVFPAAAIAAVLVPEVTEPWKRQFSWLLAIQALALSLIVAGNTHTIDEAYGIEVYSRFTLGRYFAPVIPGIVLLGTDALGKVWKPGSRRASLLVWLALATLLAAFSPLYTGGAVGIFNSPDTMYLTRLAGFDFPPWDPAAMIRAASKARWALALGLAAVGLAWSAVGAWKPRLGIALFCAAAACSSAVNLGFVTTFCEYLHRDSETFRYLASQGVDPAQLVRVGNYEPSVEFARFWLGPVDRARWLPSITVTAEELERKLRSAGAGFGGFVLTDQDAPPGLERVVAAGFGERLPLYRLSSSGRGTP